MYCCVNFSAEMYSTVFSGNFSFTLTPIACAKCVFPKPTPPKIKRGLKDVPPGLLETAKPADLASLLASPSRKFSKV